MNDNAPPPKDFKIYIDFDDEVQRYYVAKTEYAGLILEDDDPGRLVSRLRVAAADLLAVTTKRGFNQFGLLQGQSARLMPVFQVPIPVAPIVQPRVLGQGERGLGNRGCQVRSRQVFRHSTA